MVGFFASNTPDFSSQVAEFFGLAGTANATEAIATAIETAKESRAGAVTAILGFLPACSHP